MKHQCSLLLVALVALALPATADDRPNLFHNLAGQPVVKAEQDRLFKALQSWRVQTQDPLLDLTVLRALVLKEKDAPPTPVPAWKKTKPAETSREKALQ